jgi:myo-inositol-1(or 4)-monophosphatase
MQISADQISEYEAFAEQLADAAATVIQPYFRAKLDVEDKGGRVKWLHR